MQEPGFWDDQERAAGVSSEHSRTQRRLDAYRTLESDLDDLEALEELAAEDASIAGEVDEHEQLGRNDPCWCGSGKKFKRCHGS